MTQTEATTRAITGEIISKSEKKRKSGQRAGDPYWQFEVLVKDSEFPMVLRLWDFEKGANLAIGQIRSFSIRETPTGQGGFYRDIMGTTDVKAEEAFNNTDMANYNHRPDISVADEVPQTGQISKAYAQTQDTKQLSIENQVALKLAIELTGYFLQAGIAIKDIPQEDLAHLLKIGGFFARALPDLRDIQPATPEITNPDDLPF